MVKISTKPQRQTQEQSPTPNPVKKEEEKPQNSELSLIFTAIYPKVILPHSVFNITLFVQKKEEKEKKAETKKISTALHFSAKITREKETFSSLKEISVAQGKSATLSIQIPELKSPAGSEYKLILTVKENIDDGTEAKKTFEGKILRNKFQILLLAHTDKGVYKPGDIVKFRIVVLNRNLRPFPDSDSKVNVKIFDGDRNLVKMWTEAPTRHGMFSTEFPVSSDPIFGDCEIQYEALIKNQNAQEHKEKGTISFSVEKYVLPKYKMSVKLPPYITFTHEKISVRVEVKYTHGGGVKGQVKLTPSLNSALPSENSNPNQNQKHKKSSTLQHKTHQAFLHLGKKMEEAKEQTLEKILPIDDSGILQTEIGYKLLFGKSKLLNETTIFVHIEFTDGVTGKKIKESSSVPLFQFPYKMKMWVEPLNLVKGIDYTVFVKLTMQDESPISDKLKDVVKIIHQFPLPKAASASASSSVKAKDKTEKNSQEHSIEIPAGKINADGIVKITFDASATSRVNEAECKEVQANFRELTQKYWIAYYDEWVPFLVVIKNEGSQENSSSSTPIPLVKRSSDGTCQITGSVYYLKPFQFMNYFITETGTATGTGAGTETEPGMKKILEFGTKEFPAMEKLHHFKIPWSTENSSSLTEKQLVLVIFIIVGKMKVGKCDFLVKNTTTNSNSNPNSKHVKGLHENFLNISLSEETREPAQNVTVKIHTGKNSLVALKAVDESILILKNNRDIDSSSVAEVKSKRDKIDNAMAIPRDYTFSPSFRLVDEQGLRIITNGTLDNNGVVRRPRLRSWGKQLRSAISKRSRKLSSESFNITLEKSKVERQVSPPPPARVRTEFPETWIWEEILSQNGTLNLSKIVPDSLTSWVISGFSISKELGIAALSTPKTLRVNREFFLVLNLPYSVIQGEILHLQVTIHNHNSEKKEILAEITMENPEGKFEFSDPHEKSSHSKSKSLSKKTTVKPDATSFVTFPIKPVKFGLIDLKVKGSNGSKYSDALSQQLRVVPPGERQSESVAVLLTPSDKNIQLVPVFPEHSVKVDDSVKISAISDLLGATIDNMDNLIEMPYGCGEQTMLNFVVDIVVLEYLETSSQKTALRPGVREKAIKFMESGYQRELTFRHKDGSFSAFGRSDPNGSTWLTAFVLRSFLNASAFIKIEDQVISQAAEFLLKQQDEKSSGFAEKGMVHHSELVGNSGSKGVALTAFCVFALLEAKKSLKSDSYSKSIQNGLDFILQGTKENNAAKEMDLYALILTTYALHLANHKEKDKYFQKMEKAASKERDLIFWGHSDNKTSEVGNSNVKPVWIEMTGYALLIYMLREGNSNSKSSTQVASKTLPIVKWLLKHRNSRGGFISTQDTVVGLSAIAQFAKGTKSKDGAVVDLNIVAKHGKEELKIVVNQENSIVLQEFILPPSTTSVSLTASGKGSALVQLSWYYYVQNPVKQPAFSLDVIAMERPGSGIALKICTSFILAGKTSDSKSESKSNMAIVEVNFPSGYSVDKELLSSLQNISNYKRHETENQENRLNIYFESMSKTPTCVELEGLQLFKVLNAVKTYVSVYDYYDPTRRARTFYPLPFSHSKTTHAQNSVSKPIEKSNGNNKANASVSPMTAKTGQNSQANTNTKLVPKNTNKK